MNVVEIARFQPKCGWRERRMRWDQKRFTMKMINTPAATKMAAAMERLISCGRQILEMRIVQVTIRDMQNPAESVKPCTSEYAQLTKQSTIKDKLVASSPIELEDGHVGRCADDV
jgi:hypothetical protein